MSTKGQTINDRLNAAKYTLAGQALARCICKATTEELMRPKKKHLDYLAACTYESNVSMQQLTTLLIERTSHSNWAVVYKALITVHHLMSYGSERFTQFLASSNHTFQLSNFLDRVISKGYAMSTFIRRYSSYINQKALSYRTLAVDLCRTQHKSNDGVLRTMPIERLLETLPVIQKQLDSLLDFGCTADDLNNSIITASFTLLFHDSIRLFASYNDGIINLFEKYFDLNKKMCREAFEAYKRFLSVTDRVADFLKVAEAINLNRGDLPDFKRAPSSLLDALEQHLISLESNKKRDTNWPDVDTKLAAFPPFSASASLDLSPPKLSDLTKDFDDHLSFVTSNDPFETPTNSTNFDNLPTLDKPTTTPTTTAIAPKTINNIAQSELYQLESDWQQTYQATPSAIAPPVTTIGVTSTTTSTPGSLADHFAAPLNGSDLFDLSPPGFSNGSLLEPEALQISLDPSIDQHTKQQLIEIRREQIASRQNNNNNNNNNNSSSATRQSNKPSKPNKESMFEDLEKTMRQSLMKTENS